MSQESIQKFKAALQGMRDTMPLQIELMMYKAKLVREYYDELIKQEFTEQQALELCKDFKG